MPRDKYAKDRKKIETSIATSNFGSHMGYVGASKKIEASKKSRMNEDTRSAKIIRYYQGGESDTTKVEPKQTFNSTNPYLDEARKKMFETYKTIIINNPKDQAKELKLKKSNGKN